MVEFVEPNFQKDSMKIWIKKTQLIGRTAAKMVGMDC
jgi:hypothetical protein